MNLILRDNKSRRILLNIHFNPIEKTEEVKTTEILPSRAIFVVKRKVGRTMRKDIEQKTHLVADILDIE